MNYFIDIYIELLGISFIKKLNTITVIDFNVTTIAVFIPALFSALLVMVMGLINFIFFFEFNPKESELKSTYECGFIPFSDRRLNFNVNFHIVAILFIIFDLEVLFLYPWSVSFPFLGLFGFYSMVMFFLVLALGLAFEFKADILTL